MSTLIVNGGTADWHTKFLNAHGKLACLWYDTIVIPSILGRDRLLDRNRVPVNIADQLSTILRYPEEVIEGFKSPDIPEFEHEAVDIATSQEILRIANETYFKEEHPLFSALDVAGAAQTCVETLAIWSILNSRTSCSLFPDEFEARALGAVFAKIQEDDAFPAFRNLISLRLPRLNSTDWDKVLDLRHHQFIEAFRVKISELHTYSLRNDSKLLAEVFDEIQRHDLLEIAKLMRPAPGWTMCKAFVSNIPFPIPINPLSVALSAKDVFQQYKYAKKFGWLYFAIDMENMPGA